MPPQINRGQLLMFIIFLTFMLPSAPPEDAGFPPLDERKTIMNEFKDELRESRANLVNNTYHHGYGNLTGFRLSYLDAKMGRNASDWPFEDRIGQEFEEDESLSILPDIVSKLATQIWNTEDKVVELDLDPFGEDSVIIDEDQGVLSKKKPERGYWLNVTGTLRGTFERYEKEQLVPIPMPLPFYYQNLSDYNEIQRQIDAPLADPSTDSSSATFDASTLAVPGDKIGNITDDNGEIRVTFEHQNLTEASGDTTSVSLDLVVKDVYDKKSHHLHLSGAYHQDTGNLVAVTRSAKFAGFYALPHLSLQDGKAFNETKALATFSNNQSNIEDIGFDRVETLLELSGKCEFITYMHLSSTPLSKDQMKQIDDELQRPLGRPHPDVPELKITSGLLYSPDCGILLNLKEANGPRQEIEMKSLRSVVLYSMVLIAGQIWLFIKQMNATNTPSTISRISLWSISILNVVDGSICIIALIASMVNNALYIQFSVCAFLIFTCSSIFEMRYMIMIYSSQLNERTISWRTALQGTPIDERTNTNTDATDTNEGLPAPVTQPIIAQDEQAISGQLYARFFFSMIVFSFLFLNASLWPKKQRMIFEYILGFIICSFWVPQIYRNVIRGSRKSFRWDFIIGTSIIRLIPIAYVNMFTNPFYHHKDTRIVVLFAIWLVVQMLLIWCQELFGPRFFLPEKYLPKTYDYHPVLSFDDLENGFGVEHNTTSRSHNHSKCKIDCAICMNAFEVPVSSNHLDVDDREGNSNDSSVTSGALGLMARRAYMVTPCRHIFHSECLENWMKYKLQCPVCRNSLPPL